MNSRNIVKATESLQPKYWNLLIHIGKTVRLIWACITDPNINDFRKLLFILSAIASGICIFFMDVLPDWLAGIIIPLIGFVAGIPIDLVADWLLIPLVIIGLIKLFPKDRVAFHYAEIFGNAGRM